MKYFNQFTLILSVLFMISASSLFSNPDNRINCYANSTFGASCEASVSLDADKPLNCKFGLFSAICYAGENEPERRLPEFKPYIPFLIPDVEEDVLDLKEYCANYGTKNMNELSIRILDVYESIKVGNKDWYNKAEDAYRTQFLNLTNAERRDIHNWVVNRGYDGFMEEYNK